MNDGIVQAINDFGFPVIAAGGLGYFVYYTWNWVVKDIKPVLDESTGTLIGLIDRIRMLDNDMIRLNTKIQMILQEQEQQLRAERQNRRKESAHKINLENISAARKKTIKDELKSLSIQANLAAQRTPLNVFMTNLQSRIYSELSKQVTEQLFADTGTDSGSFDLDGNV